MMKNKSVNHYIHILDKVRDLPYIYVNVIFEAKSNLSTQNFKMLQNHI